MSLNQQEFTRLHQQYHGRLLHSMTAFTRNCDEAEDITSTAFAAAFKNLKCFRGEASFYTYLYRIAHNDSISRRRRPTVSLETVDGAVSSQLAEPDHLAQMLERRDCCKQVRAALRRIPAIYRRVLVDHFVRNQPVKLIARNNRIPAGTVLSRIFTAKRLLCAAWEA
jgi:RNA polymerase sigma-70 factor, ECF subfamily